MTAHPFPGGHDYELTPIPSLETEDSASLLSTYDEQSSHLITRARSRRHQTRPRSLLRQCLIIPVRWLCQSLRNPPHRRNHNAYLRRSFIRKFTLLAYSVLAVAVALVITAGTLFPSYTHLPRHYRQLANRVSASSEDGRGNPSQQKVFIAATLADQSGELTGGQWGQNIIDLIRLLGPENTFLSIYENAVGPRGGEALKELEKKVPGRHSLVFEPHLDMQTIPHSVVPDGSSRIRRMEYLARMRNQALAPLDDEKILYDKLLYLNDVFFNPVDLLQLLFSTNMDETGQANYRAACAIDFIDPIKFYDTFATRDIGGNRVGVPIFPWFAYYGDKRSHQDVLRQTDAVRVKSCWGGAVAFDMRFFQQQSDANSVPETAGSDGPSNYTAPFRFRAEKELFWEASECCLIQADIQSTDPENTGIYVNPYVRVAYDQNTLSWLWFSRRFERLYTPIQYLLNIVLSFPKYNPRAAEKAWQEVEEEVWVPDTQIPAGGSFQTLQKVATNSGFCGLRMMSVLNSNTNSGGKYWEHIPVPT